MTLNVPVSGYVFDDQDHADDEDKSQHTHILRLSTEMSG